MLFSKAETKKDLKETMQIILQEIKENKTTEARDISLKSAIAHIHHGSEDRVLCMDPGFVLLPGR